MNRLVLLFLLLLKLWYLYQQCCFLHKLFC